MFWLQQVVPEVFIVTIFLPIVFTVVLSVVDLTLQIAKIPILCNSNPGMDRLNIHEHNATKIGVLPNLDHQNIRNTDFFNF